MSDTRQHIGSASGFSPASTSFQQTGGESVRLSSIGYASPQGHMPYPDNHLGQPSVGFSPQHGYMSYPEKSRPTSFVSFRFQQPAQRDTTWGQAPIQHGWNVPAHHHVEQSTAFAPFFSSVKSEPELNQQMQFPPKVEQSFSMVPPCSTGYLAFGSRLQNQVYYKQGQTQTQKRSALPFTQTALQ